jgi:hypothetical protein
VKLAPRVITTVTTTVASSNGPEAAIIAKLIEAPRSMTATSSTCFALNAIPDCQRPDGVQKPRMIIPNKIAITSASTYGCSNQLSSRRSKPMETTATRMQSKTPGNSFARPPAAVVNCPFGEGGSFSQGTKNSPNVESFYAARGGLG